MCAAAAAAAAVAVGVATVVALLLVSFFFMRHVFNSKMKTEEQSVGRIENGKKKKTHKNTHRERERSTWLKN